VYVAPTKYTVAVSFLSKCNILLSKLRDKKCFVNTVCNFGHGWDVGYLTGVHTQYKALLPTEVKATVGVHIGLRGVNITLLGKHLAYRRSRCVQDCVVELSPIHTTRSNGPSEQFERVVCIGL